MLRILYIPLFVLLFTSSGYSEAVIQWYSSSSPTIGPDLGDVRVGQKIEMACTAYMLGAPIGSSTQGSLRMYEDFGPDPNAFSIDDSVIILPYFSNRDDIHVHFFPKKIGKYKGHVSIVISGYYTDFYFTANVIDTLSGTYMEVSTTLINFDTVRTVYPTQYFAFQSLWISTDSIHVWGSGKNLKYFQLENDAFDLKLGPGGKAYAQTIRFYSFNTPGTYRDTFILYNNAGNTAHPVLIPIYAFVPEPSSVRPLSREKISAYPDPFHDDCTIMIASSYGGSCDVEIYDELGRIVFRKKNYALNAGNNYINAGRDLLAGSYTAVCNNNGKTITLKLVKY